MDRAVSSVIMEELNSIMFHRRGMAFRWTQLRKS